MTRRRRSDTEDTEEDTGEGERGGGWSSRATQIARVTREDERCGAAGMEDGDGTPRGRGVL